MTAIDVHAHLMPSAAFERVPAGLTTVRDDANRDPALFVDARGVRGRSASRALRDVATHSELQAARGIDLSVVGPWIDMVKAPLDPAVQDAWCRVVNEELTRVATSDSRYEFLAALPDLDGARAAECLETAVASGAVGGMLSANPESGSLDRGDFEALWDAAERLGVPLVLHPGEFQVPERLQAHFMVNLVGNPFETTLAVGSLLASGVPDRHPDLKVVLVHGGGFFPYQFGRLDAGFERWLGLGEVGRKRAREHLRWFHYDTVLFEDEPTRYLIDLVGDDRVLAGSDCPFRMTDYRPFSVPPGLALDENQQARILGGNARALFGLDGAGDSA